MKEFPAKNRKNIAVNFLNRLNEAGNGAQELTERSGHPAKQLMSKLSPMRSWLRFSRTVIKQVCAAAEMAVRYAALCACRKVHT